MKQRIVIHVGMPRAGSSTLQEALFFHRDALAQSGIAYAVLQNPISGYGKPGFEYNHRLLNAAAKGFLRPRDNFHPMMKGIIDGVRQRPDHVTILSYEGWWDPRNLGPLRRVLQHIRKELPDADVRLCAVVREPVSFLLSLYKLDVLHGRTLRPFIDELPKALTDPRLSYGRISAALANAARVDFLDFATLAAGDTFCGAALAAMTGTDLSRNPALSAFCRHRSGGTAYFSDAVVSMMRLVSGHLGLKTVQRHRQEILNILLRLSRDPRISPHLAELIIPLGQETESRITAATGPLVQGFYAQHLPAADIHFAAHHDGRAQSDIDESSPLGREVLGATSAFSKTRSPWWRLGALSP